MLADGKDNDDEEGDEGGNEEARGTRISIELACGVIDDDKFKVEEGAESADEALPVVSTNDDDAKEEDDEVSSGTKLFVSPKSSNDGGAEIGILLFGKTAYVAEDTSVNIVCWCCCCCCCCC